MVVTIGGNLALLWPLISMIEPGGFPREMLYPALGALLIALPGVTVPLFGPQLLERGRRLRATDASAVLAADRRPPILYLRSFEDDDLPDPALPSIFAVYRLGFRPPFVRHRYERTLTQALSRIGPVICLGRPGDEVPEVGAARFYVFDEVWPTAVTHCLRHSSAVVFTIGHGRALWWEIETALKLIPLERLLFFFPYAESPTVRGSTWRKYYAFLGLGLVTRRMLARMEAERQSRYTMFRERTRGLLSERLPALGTSAFLTFSHDGSPRLLETTRVLDKAIMWRFSNVSWTQIDLERTLRPFLEQREKAR
jgi:hypothetical protein